MISTIHEEMEAAHAALNNIKDESIVIPSHEGLLNMRIDVQQSDIPKSETVEARYSIMQYQVPVRVKIDKLWTGKHEDACMKGETVTRSEEIV